MKDDEIPCRASVASVVFEVLANGHGVLLEDLVRDANAMLRDFDEEEASPDVYAACLTALARTGRVEYEDVGDQRRWYLPDPRVDRRARPAERATGDAPSRDGGAAEEPVVPRCVCGHSLDAHFLVAGCVQDVGDVECGCATYRPPAPSSHAGPCSCTCRSPDPACASCGIDAPQWRRETERLVLEADDLGTAWDARWRALVEVPASRLTPSEVRERRAIVALAEHIRGPGIAALREILARPCEHNHGRMRAYTPCHARGPKGPVRRRENWCPTCIARTAFDEDVRARFVSEAQRAARIEAAARAYVTLMAGWHDASEVGAATRSLRAALCSCTADEADPACVDHGTGRGGT